MARTARPASGSHGTAQMITLAIRYVKTGPRRLTMTSADVLQGLPTSQTLRVTYALQMIRVTIRAMNALGTPIQIVVQSASHLP